MAEYLDSSALAKLVIAEADSSALLHWLTHDARLPTSSDLARTELLRAVRRVDPERMLAARAVLDSVVLLGITAVMYDSAGRLDPTALRSLDALHLTCALALGDDLDCLVTYDLRMAEAAQGLGITVRTPK